MRGFGLFLAALVASTAAQHLKVVTLHASPFTMKLDSDGQHTGFLIDLLDELKAKMNNVSFDLYVVPDGKYGERINDQWNGLIGEVQSGRANIALAPLTITQQRQKVVDFTIPFMQTGIGIMFRKPDAGEQLPFSSIGELSTHANIVYGTISGGSTYQFFQNNAFPLYKAVGDSLRERPTSLVTSIDEALQRARSSNYAFLGESTMIDYYVGQPPCDLMRIGDLINAVGYGLAFRKRSPLVETFNYKIRQLSDEGTLEKLRERWWTQECPKPKLCVCASSGHKKKHEEKEDDGTVEVEDDEHHNDHGEGETPKSKRDGNIANRTLASGLSTLMAFMLVALR